MFGFRGGETPQTVSRKRGYLSEAQQKWPFLTYFDLSTIKNETQLRSVVKDRSGVTEDQARADVASWLVGKTF
jgi:hypothetical protein